MLALVPSPTHLLHPNSGGANCPLLSWCVYAICKDVQPTLNGPKVQVINRDVIQASNFWYYPSVLTTLQCAQQVQLFLDLATGSQLCNDGCSALLYLIKQWPKHKTNITVILRHMHGQLFMGICTQATPITQATLWPSLTGHGSSLS